MEQRMGRCKKQTIYITYGSLINYFRAPLIYIITCRSNGIKKCHDWISHYSMPDGRYNPILWWICTTFCTYSIILWCAHVNFIVYFSEMNAHRLVALPADFIPTTANKTAVFGEYGFISLICVNCVKYLYKS